VEDSTWLDEGTSDEADGQIDEYDLTSTPNDFNVTTIFSFIQSGAVKIPGFQRNYVWDRKRASKLIESLIIGLPVPQIFLYEEGRNSFLVIDGQQRLMTIYYFKVGRFPRREKRAEIRRVFEEYKGIPEEVLKDDALFEPFRLRLSELGPGRPNKFSGLTYESLGDYSAQFELRTIRNVIVKQVKPTGDDSSIYEMFNRLNTGGINLTPQEIRASLYHSPFYDALFNLNMDIGWRRLIGSVEPDLHMRDIEVLLRGLALSRRGQQYAPSMVRFLNEFSKLAQAYSPNEVDRAVEDVKGFLEAVAPVSPEVFQTRQGRFSLPLFDAIFPAVLAKREEDPAFLLSASDVRAVSADEEFQGFSQEQTTNTSNVKGRLERGTALVGSGDA